MEGGDSEAGIRDSGPRLLLLCHSPVNIGCLQPNDGGFYLWQVQPVAQGYGSEAPLIEEEAPDIVDDAAYSIQEDKLKTEDDNR